MEISRGDREDGIVIGNVYDKYNSNNPIVRFLMGRFSNALNDFVQKADPKDIHEVGCGEGYWVLHWLRQGFKARGSDFSKNVIDIAKNNALEKGVTDYNFEQISIYDLIPERDSADLIVCCEVLEHLEDPNAGLAALQRIAKNYTILSVPREPLWCSLNFLRGKYMGYFGNTPGHINHWSKNGFLCLVKKYFDIIEVKSPIPWTMVLCRQKQL